MTGQLSIAKVEVAVQPVLKVRQQLVWDYLRTVPGGITADEAGAYVHAHRGSRPHSVDERCEECARTGLSVLRSKALRPLVIRRKASGRYECRNPKDRASEPTVQTVELAGETFEDIFA